MSKSNIEITKAKEGLQYFIDHVPYNKHLIIDACNDFVLYPDWGFKNRINDNFHIAFLKSGHASYILGSDEEKMHAGKMVLVSPRYCHSRVLNKKNLPKFTLVRFSIRDNYSFELVNNLFQSFGFATQPKHASKYYRLFGTLVDYYKDETAKNGTRMSGIILFQILYELYNDILQEEFSFHYDKRIHFAMHYIEDHIKSNLSCSMLAEIAGLSKNYFRLQFKNVTGICPKQYIINSRIKKAHELLVETSYSIKHVADLLGYCDAYAFSKQFKKVMGYSPSKCKKEMIQEE